MKKLIASLLVLVFGATMVMAEVPAPGAETREAVAVSTADFDDVEGVGLNESEKILVQGEGLIGAVIGASGGAVGGAIGESCRTAYRMVTKKENRSGKQIANDIVESAKWGALTGAIWGAVTGL
ncbi:MAG: hypothetical protein LDL24_10800 [Treponema sp.]|nr:hypothetical protein [Treponema sp.]